MESTSWAQDSRPPTISLAEVKPNLCRFWTALWESLPLLQITYSLARELPFRSSSSFKAEEIWGNLASKLGSGMFKDLGRETILKWWAGRTSTNTCASPLATLSWYSLLLILESDWSSSNFKGDCSKFQISHFLVKWERNQIANKPKHIH